jgi:hypothetical protein
VTVIVAGAGGVVVVAVVAGMVTGAVVAVIDGEGLVDGVGMQAVRTRTPPSTKPFRRSFISEPP